MENEVIENVEVGNTSLENEIESVSGESSEVEQVSIQNQQEISNPINYNDFSGIVIDHKFNTNLYEVSLVEDDGDKLETYTIPKDLSQYIVVADGHIYNLSSSTVYLTAYTDYGFYYRMLEIPPYGSEEYYRFIAEHGKSYKMQCAVNDGDVLRYVPSDAEGVHFEANSQLNGWDLTTIFLFIIIVILIVKNAFRRGL